MYEMFFSSGIDANYVLLVFVAVLLLSSVAVWENRRCPALTTTGAYLHLAFFFVHSFPETMICGGKNTVIFFSRCVAMFVLSCYINYRRHWFYRKRCIYE